MDVRTSKAAPLRWAHEWFDRVNARHPWSHNDHFHGWILRRLPSRRVRALDVGCGRGLLLSRLADRFQHAQGLDRDAEMVRSAGGSAADVAHGEFMDASIEPGLDAITMVAVLHHFDHAPAMRRAAQLLAPGGRLLVVGLARVAGTADRVLDLLSLLANPLMGLVKHPRRAAETPGPPPFPVTEPTASFAEIRAIAARELPGARLRRRLFFRYTLEWTKPAVS